MSTILDILPPNKYYFKIIKLTSCKILLFVYNKNKTYLIHMLPSQHKPDDFLKDNKFIQPNNFHYNVMITDDIRQQNKKELIWVVDTPELYEKIKDKIIDPYLKKQFEIHSYIVEMLSDKIPDRKILLVNIYTKIYEIITQRYVVNDYHKKIIKDHLIYSLIDKIQTNLSLGTQIMIDKKYVKSISEIIDKFGKDFANCTPESNTSKLTCKEYNEDSQIRTLILNLSKDIAELNKIIFPEIMHEREANDKYLFKFNYNKNNIIINVVGTPDPTKMTTNLSDKNISFIHYNFWIKNNANLFTLRDLRSEHIDFLETLHTSFKEFIFKTFGITINDKNYLKIYCKYPPNSIWQFYLDAVVSEIINKEYFKNRNRIHDIEQIICNLKFDKNHDKIYYRDMTFNYLLEPWNDVYKLYNLKGGNWNSLLKEKYHWTNPIIKSFDCGIVKMTDYSEINNNPVFMISIIHEPNITEVLSFLKSIKLIPRFYTGNYVYFVGYPDKKFEPYKLLYEEDNFEKNDREYFDEYIEKSFIETPDLKEKVIHKQSKINYEIPHLNEQFDIIKKNPKYYFETDNFFVMLNIGRIPNNKKITDDITVSDGQIYYVCWWKPGNITRDDTKNYLYSLRTLKATHKNELINLKNVVHKFLIKHYDIEEQYIDSYIHYPVSPKYSKLHIHFTFNKNKKFYYDTTYQRHNRIYSLNSVICTLDLYENYYQNADLVVHVPLADYNDIY